MQNEQEIRRSILAIFEPGVLVLQKPVLTSSLEFNQVAMDLGLYKPQVVKETTDSRHSYNIHILHTESYIHIYLSMKADQGNSASNSNVTETSDLFQRVEDMHGYQ